MYCTVRVTFSEKPDGGLWGAVDDKVQIDCGDFGDGRLQAFQGEVISRIDKAWSYLASLRQGPPTVTGTA